MNNQTTFYKLVSVTPTGELKSFLHNHCAARKLTLRPEVDVTYTPNSETFPIIKDTRLMVFGSAEDASAACLASMVFDTTLGIPFQIWECTVTNPQKISDIVPVNMMTDNISDPFTMTKYPKFSLSKGLPQFWQAVTTKNSDQKMKKIHTFSTGTIGTTTLIELSLDDIPACPRLTLDLAPCNTYAATSVTLTQRHNKYVFHHHPRYPY